LIGAILAGGAGRRIGGAKATRMLGGRPLASYPAAALAQECERVAIVAKPGVELPDLPGVERWDDEPAEPRHPLTGIVHALERAAGEPVLICAADMPYVTADALRTLAAAGTTSIAVADGVLQPVLGLYAPDVLAALTAAEPNAPLTRTVEGLGPELVPLPSQQVRSIDTPEDLASAEAP
jgi:molybdopterin-guanine dinucleotide biosynthesis protein A